MTLSRLLATLLAASALAAPVASRADPPVPPGASAELYPGNRIDLRDGRAVYRANCARCHDRGRNHAPRLRHPKDWNAASFESLSVLQGHASKGFLNMPRKGGHELLSEQELTEAVLFMQERILGKRGVKP